MKTRIVQGEQGPRDSARGSRSSRGPENLAARMGRWSAQHRKKAIWGWLAFVILAFAVGGAVGTETQDTAQSGVGESGRAERTIDDAFPKHAVEQVLVQSSTTTANDAFVQGERSPMSSIAFPRCPTPRTSTAPTRRATRADLGRRALRPASLRDRRRPRTRPRTVSVATLDATAAAQAANPDFTVEQFGDASVDKELNEAISDDFKQAFVTSLPITLVILLIAFGALVAASVPIILALTAVLATIGLVGLLSHISPVDSSINEVILLIGLAVGVDYSMFYLRREREERESGRSEEASLAAAAATSGRAVLVSGLTVMVAMAGMYLGGAPTFTSFATGTIIVVAVAVVGSLTVLPALLAWLGDRVEKGGVPIIKDQPWNATRERHLVADPDPGAAPSRRSRRPLAAALLIVLAIPTLQHPYGDPGHRDAAAEPERGQDLQQDPGGLPRWADPGRRGGQRRRRDLARGQRRDRRPAQAGRREPAASSSRSRRTSAPIGRSRRSTSRWPAMAATRSRTRRWPSSATIWFPATIGQRARRHGGRRRLHRRLEGLQRHPEVARAAASSPSSSRRRSCCCW